MVLKTPILNQKKKKSVIAGTAAEAGASRFAKVETAEVTAGAAAQKQEAVEMAAEEIADAEKEAAEKGKRETCSVPKIEVDDYIRVKFPVSSGTKDLAVFVLAIREKDDYLFHANRAHEV